MHFLFCPSHGEFLVQFMNRKQLIFEVALSSKWPSNPWITLHFSPQWIRNLFLFLCLYLFFRRLHPPPLILWSTSWNEVCMCVSVCMYVCVLQPLSSCDRVVWQAVSHSGQVVDGSSPTCDRACQSQRFPTFLAICRLMCGLLTHTTTAVVRVTLTPKPALTTYHPWLVFLSLQASSCKTWRFEESCLPEHTHLTFSLQHVLFHPVFLLVNDQSNPATATNKPPW